MIESHLAGFAQGDFLDRQQQRGWVCLHPKIFSRFKKHYVRLLPGNSAKCYGLRSTGPTDGMLGVPPVLLKTQSYHRNHLLVVSGTSIHFVVENRSNLL